MRTVSRAYVKESKVEQEPIETVGTLAIRFQIDDEAIEVWFDEQRPGIIVRSATGFLEVRPRGDNVIIVRPVKT